MAKHRKEIWLGLAVLAVGMIPVAVAGLWGYMSITATPIHPVPADVPSVTRSDPPAKWAAAVSQGRESVRTALNAQNLPGVSVAVGIDGQIVWAEGFGWADLERRMPVTPETRFRIGTASIPLTAAAVGLLLEQGRLNLEEEIQTHVPEFPKKPWPVTLRQVMGHRSGIRYDGGDESPMLSRHCDRPVEALAIFAGWDLLFEPGTRFSPSWYGWSLVSAAVEAAAGQPFLTFMHDRVFEPLRMHDTLADSATENIANRTTGYFPRFAADPRYGPDIIREIDLSCYAGASEFLSTPADLVRFATGVENGELLQPATVERLQTSEQLPSGEETGYGLGWDLENVSLLGEPARIVGHDGLILGGTAVSFWTNRERKITVAVTSNISYAGTPAIALHIAQAFAGEAKETKP